jgi:hypothetical protein
LKLTTIITILLISTTAAIAEPPPGSDPNSPLAHWYQSLRQPANGTQNGMACCSEADCRPVDFRMAGDHYEVFIDRKTFGPEAPNTWLPVPKDNVIVKAGNPTGSGVACYYIDQILCFVPGTQG